MVIFISAHAQIKVTSTGNVGIGLTNPSHKMHIYGTVQINPNSFTGGLIIDKSHTSQYGDLPTIKPNSPWYGALGTSDNYFGYSYIHTMHSHVNYTANSRCKTHVNNYNYTFSDISIKSNIKKIDNAYSLLTKLDGKKYDMLPPNFGLETDKEKKEQKLKKDEYGFIAQDFIKILPELVLFDSITELYAINYIGIIPIIVEALKEQDIFNKSITDEFAKLRSENAYKSTIIIEDEKFVDSASLSQNIPNPFTSNTRIDILLPENVINAQLYVYNMQGTQIMKYEINERGQTSVTIEGYALNAGMYLYTLIADGKEVDTKKMILTK